MNLSEMKKKAFALIEELNPDSEYLTDDVDMRAKVNDVINQVMYELARMKKISRDVEMKVSRGDRITFEDLERESGYVVYQIGCVHGVNYDLRANGTVLKILEDGVAEIDLFVYPERITENTKDKAYEFELSEDALEIMPYGVAGDLLRSDVSAEYGNVYSTRYESMLQRLDPRYHMNTITFEGGYNI